MIQLDPLRTPDWRWQKAVEMQAIKGQRTALRDPLIKRCRLFLASYNQSNTARQKQLAADRYPEIFQAWRIWRFEGSDVRATIEARVLANQSAEEIAQRHCTTKEVIETYEKIFFDVRDYLECRDWIANMVIGPAPHHGDLTEKNYPCLLKIYAVCGGPLVVDALVEMHSRTGEIPKNRKELKAFWREDSAGTLGRKAAIAARCLPVNSYTHRLVLESYHKLLEIEQAQGAAQQEAPILESLNDLLKSLPLKVCDTAVEKSGSSVQMQGNATLRTSELLKPTATANPQELSQYTFPDSSQDSMKGNTHGET